MWGVTGNLMASFSRKIEFVIIFIGYNLIPLCIRNENLYWGHITAMKDVQINVLCFYNRTFEFEIKDWSTRLRVEYLSTSIFKHK